MPSIRKRGNIYYVYWYEGGVKRGKGVSPSKLVAQEYANKIEQGLYRSKAGLRQPNLSFEAFRTRYLEYSLTSKAPDSYKRDLNTLKAFDKVLHIKTISELNTPLLEQYKALRKASGIENSSINRELGTLRNMIRKMSEWDLLDLPGKMTKDLPTIQKKLRFFTKEEVKKILKMKPSVWKSAIIAGLYTGMRGGEVRTLTWESIDLRNKRISLENTKEQKLKYIPINKKLHKYLVDLRKDKGNLIDNEGEMFTKGVFSTMIKKTFRKIGLKDCSFHTLRHTFISHLIMAGVDVFTIAKLVGHSDLDMIYKVYGHLLPGHTLSAVDKLPF